MPADSRPDSLKPLLSPSSLVIVQLTALALVVTLLGFGFLNLVRLDLFQFWFLAVLLIPPFVVTVYIGSWLASRWGVGAALFSGESSRNGSPYRWVWGVGRVDAIGHSLILMYYMYLAACLDSILIYAADETSLIDLDLYSPTLDALPGAGAAVLGGLGVGGAFVILHLRQYTALEHSLDRQKQITLLLCGCLIALAPIIPFVTLVFAEPVDTSSEQPPYVGSLSVHVENVSKQGDQVRMNVWVLFEGYSGGVKAEDVQVVFVADNGSTTKTIPVGTLKNTGSDMAYPPFETNVTVTRPPKELRLRIGNVEIPENSRFSARGMRRTSVGPIRYSQFIQDEY